MPTTPADVGLDDVGGDDLMTVAAVATVPSETIHNMPFSVDAAGAYGRAFREGARAEEHPVSVSQSD